MKQPYLKGVVYALLILEMLSGGREVLWAQTGSDELPAELDKALQEIEEQHEAKKYRAYLQSLQSDPSSSSSPTVVHGAPAEGALARQRAYESSIKDSEREAERQRRKAIRRGLSKESVRDWFDRHPGLSRWLRATFVKGPSTPLSRLVNDWVQEPLEPYTPDPAQEMKWVQFLRENVTAGGLPLSYKVPPGYWQQTKQMMEEADACLERIITENGLSIYDGALWQIALGIAGAPSDQRSVYAHTDRLVSGTSGELKDIRAFGPTYLYGPSKKVFDAGGGFFFRIIADRYIQEDPILGLGPVQNFPNFQTPHHEDWKPIMGEQAWGAIIGPLQIAYLRYGGNIPLTSPEVRLALSVLDAVEAMQSEIGGIYHAPEGTFGKNPDDISNENNFSMYAALKILAQVLRRGGETAQAERIEVIRRKQEDYIAQYAFDRVENIFYQGGLYKDGEFHPALIFALDCQTWGILAMGPEWIDRTYGEGTAYRIWVRAKEHAGFWKSDGALGGVGFSDGHRMMSVEWTAGAILATRVMAEYYRPTHLDWSRELLRDSISMRRGCEEFRTPTGSKSEAFLYANRRYFIPFSWWANPIPSMASTAWIILIDRGFNPFVLGGGQEFSSEKSV